MRNSYLTTAQRSALLVIGNQIEGSGFHSAEFRVATGAPLVMVGPPADVRIPAGGVSVAGGGVKPITLDRRIEVFAKEWQGGIYVNYSAYTSFLRPKVFATIEITSRNPYLRGYAPNFTAPMYIPTARDITNWGGVVVVSSRVAPKQPETALLQLTTGEFNVQYPETGSQSLEVVAVGLAVAADPMEIASSQSVAFEVGVAGVVFAADPMDVATSQSDTVDGAALVFSSVPLGVCQADYLWPDATHVTTLGAQPTILAPIAVSIPSGAPVFVGEEIVVSSRVETRFSTASVGVYPQTVACGQTQNQWVYAECAHIDLLADDASVWLASPRYIRFGAYSGEVAGMREALSGTAVPWDGTVSDCVFVYSRESQRFVEGGVGV